MCGHSIPSRVCPTRPSGIQSWPKSGLASWSARRTKSGKAFATHQVDNPLHVVKGWFADTFPVEAPKIDQIAVLHIDADWYESVKLVLRTFYPKVAPGGWVIFDDYQMWNGAKLAAEEYRREMNIELPLMLRHVWQKRPEGLAQQPNVAV